MLQGGTEEVRIDPNSQVVYIRIRGEFFVICDYYYFLNKNTHIFSKPSLASLLTRKFEKEIYPLRMSSGVAGVYDRM